jgi:hypothetical protein
VQGEMMDYFIVATLLIALLLIAVPVAIYIKEYLRLRKMTYDEFLKETGIDSQDKDYQYREIMRPKYYGLCGAVKVRQRKMPRNKNPFSEWEDI